MTATATVSITVCKGAIIVGNSGSCSCSAVIACKVCTGSANDTLEAFDGVVAPLAAILARLGWADWWLGHRPGRLPAGRVEELLW